MSTDRLSIAIADRYRREREPGATEPAIMSDVRWRRLTSKRAP